MGFWIETNVRVTKESDVVLKFLAHHLELIVSIHVSSLVELDLLSFEWVDLRFLLSCLSSSIDTTLKYCTLYRRNIKQEAEKICKFFHWIQNEILITQDKSRYFVWNWLQNKFMIIFHVIHFTRHPFIPEFWKTFIDFFIEFLTVTSCEHKTCKGWKHINRVANYAEHLLCLENFVKFPT